VERGEEEEESSFQRGRRGSRASQRSRPYSPARPVVSNIYFSHRLGLSRLLFSVEYFMTWLQLVENKFFYELDRRGYKIYEPQICRIKPGVKNDFTMFLISVSEFLTKIFCFQADFW
jgi:hypothetical protein